MSTVDSVARRQAILFEIGAISSRIAADESLKTDEQRMDDLANSMDDLADALDGVRFFNDTQEESLALRELAGKCLARLEHLEAEKAKA